MNYKMAIIYVLMTDVKGKKSIFFFKTYLKC